LWASSGVLPFFRSPFSASSALSAVKRVSAALAVAAWAAAAAAAPPARVASVNLAADEVLSEILPPERLVSVTRWVDEPGTSNIIGRVPKSIYRFAKADMEQLVALHPDLVVVSEYTDADFQRLLERSGMRVHRMQGMTSLAGIRGAILDLGRAVGEEAGAVRLVARYDRVLRDVAWRLEGAPRPRVLYWSSGMTAGADTAIGAVLEGAGAVNVGRELGVVGIQPPGAERAFTADPDAIVVGTWPKAEESVKDHPLLLQLRAVREGHIVAVPSEKLLALSQYTADGVWDLASRLHPDRVPAELPAELRAGRTP
jgi:iron complex transport system substrate-binding protein